jgi:hypothetical protein
VESVEYKGNDTILKLAEKLPESLSSQVIVANHHYRTANVRIANCKFNRGGRGVLTDADNLTIESCVFDHTFGQAVQLAIDIVPPLWAEGMPTANVVIRNNRIDGVNAAGRTDGAAICTFTRWPAGTTAYPLYRDVVMENNQFLNTIGPAISLSNCQNVVVRGNSVEVAKTATDLSAGAIVASYSSDLKLGGNYWLPGEALKKPGVLHDPQTTARVIAADNRMLPPTTRP